jgi:hypothetical protein
MVVTTGSCGAFGGVPVPTEYTTTGVSNTDVIFFVTARPTQGSVVAVRNGNHVAELLTAIYSGRFNAKKTTFSVRLLVS